MCVGVVGLPLPSPVHLELCPGLDPRQGYEVVADVIVPGIRLQNLEGDPGNPLRFHDIRFYKNVPAFLYNAQRNILAAMDIDMLLRFCNPSHPAWGNIMSYNGNDIRNIFHTSAFPASSSRASYFPA